MNVPLDGVSMKIRSWIEPKINPLLSICLAISDNISLQDNWPSVDIPKEFKVDLIPSSSIRRLELEETLIKQKCYERKVFAKKKEK